MDIKQLFLSAISTTVVNLIIFSIVPFLWWLFRHRKEQNFFQWIGFIKPECKVKCWMLIVFAAVYVFFYNFDFTSLVDQQTLEYLSNHESVAANTYAGIGAFAILPALLENYVANGVAEEILYRGFLCKRLCEKFGSISGMIIQAILFGLMHNLLFLAAGIQVGIWYHILMFTFTGMGALLLGILNEKIYNGSIIPSILLHGTGNFIATMLVAF